MCEAQGNPAPNITWKRADGFPLPNGGFQQRVRQNIRHKVLMPVFVKVRQRKNKDLLYGDVKQIGKN